MRNCTLSHRNYGRRFYFLKSRVLNNESIILQVFNESGVEIPIQEKDLPPLLLYISQQEHCSFNFVELVYVSEDEIIRINKEHLQKNYITDVITFRYDEAASKKEIEGTIFCCAARIQEQAVELGEPEKREFLRIFIHGILHLVGYDDTSTEEKSKMSELEDKYLAYVNS